MLNKSSAEMAATGFSLLLSFAIYAVVNALVTTFLGPISFLKSVPMLGLLGLLQITAFGLCFRWSKEKEASTPLLVLLASYGLVFVGAVSGSGVAMGLAGWCVLAAIFAFLTWLHRLYQNLERKDLLRLESILAPCLLLVMLGQNLIPPSVRAIVVFVSALSLSGYFAYVFCQLRQVALDAG